MFCLQQISDTRLTSFRVQEAGRFLAVGAADGSTSLIELCEGLSVMQTNEKQSINQIFERETKREKNLEDQAKDPLQKASSQSMSVRFGMAKRGRRPWAGFIS